MKYILIAFLLAGCATTALLEEQLNSWNNQPLDDLVQSWGAPTSSYVTPGGYTFLVYNMDAGYNGYTGQNYYCKIDFTANKSRIITNWKYYGTGCKSK